MPSFADNLRRKSITEHACEEAENKLKQLAAASLPSTNMINYYISENHLKNILAGFDNDKFQNIVFVGTRKEGFLTKLLSDSMAIQVIENTLNIVVAMPKEINSFSHKKIYVAVSDKHPLNILELNNFLELLDKSKTQITFFYLAKPGEETNEIEKTFKDLTKLYVDRYLTGYAVYEGKSAMTDIKNVITNKTDEILIVQKGSRFLTDQIFR